MADSNSTLTDSSHTTEAYRAMVRPALREVVGRLHPDVVRAAAGGCARPGAEEDHGLCPALALLSAAAVGGRAWDAVPGAVAVELARLFARTHRGITGAGPGPGGPVRGVGPAVLAGDGFLALALRTLAETTCLSLLSSALVDLVHGEAAAAALHGRPDTVTVGAYTAASARTRGALLGCAAGIGARLGGAPPDVVCRLTVAGRELGVALHAADDLAALGTGRPRPLSYPVLYALEAADGTAGELADLLAEARAEHGGARFDEATGRRVADLAVRAGGVARTRETARHRLDEVLRTVDAVSVAPQAARQLSALVRSAVERTH
ncbi:MULTISPECIES: polyprenyl synthetase family protein [unclassified Streptomyces]|uniref:polyprenyl synthetase family protein n=1 Tax=unclassified Streptomyces TaxID=2593676 RepID=UPI00340774B2